MVEVEVEIKVEIEIKVKRNLDPIPDNRQKTLDKRHQTKDIR
jgi:hypothetical protein